MLANLAAVAAVAWGPAEIARVPGHVVLRAASPRAGAPVAGDSSDLETDFDEVLRRELEKAFAGMKVDALDDTEESRFRLIEAETQRVLSAVLEEMDASSDALRAQLEAKGASLADEETRRMLAKLEKSTSAVDQTLLATRRTVREEMATLRQLKTDYEKLQEEKAQGRKSGLLGAAVLLAGLGALSTGLTDLLRVATGASGGDVATQGAVEVVFGLVGVYIYQSRQ